MNEILHGDVIEKLKELETGTVQCVVTSPPYWGLRNYQVEKQLGLEKTPEEYVEKMVEVFRQIKRVLKHDGTVWLNLGDSYNGRSTNRSGQHGYNDGRSNRSNRFSVGGINGLKPKDIVGIPWRVAFALQADGWYLRQDIVWHKPNPMPESVQDRCTKSHEFIFLLTKSARYYYDNDAIAERATCGESRPDGIARDRMLDYDSKEKKLRPSKKRGEFGGKWKDMKGQEAFRAVRETRNRRSVWTINTQPYKEAHFATFPKKLPELCIKAGSKEGDIILDPFFGSGTTGWVAQRLGRQWIGIELNEEYIKIANKRFAQRELFIAK